MLRDLEKRRASRPIDSLTQEQLKVMVFHFNSLQFCPDEDLQT